jgi:DNA-binding NarL/FixJ family response regulator
MTTALIADDSKPVRDALRFMLDAEGIENCVEAADGKTAIEQAKHLNPDLVILDYRMPGIDGVQVAYEIRQFAPHSKIIFYTVYDSPETEAAARVMGASAFVSKLAPKEIILAVRRLMKGENVRGTGIGP